MADTSYAHILALNARYPRTPGGLTTIIAEMAITPPTKNPFGVATNAYSEVCRNLSKNAELVEVSTLLANRYSTPSLYDVVYIPKLGEIGTGFHVVAYVQQEEVAYDMLQRVGAALIQYAVPLEQLPGRPIERYEPSTHPDFKSLIVPEEYLVLAATTRRG